MKRCVNRGFGIFVFFMWKIQTLKSVKILLKYSKRLPRYQIKIDLCFVADTNAIQQCNISDTKTSYYIIFKTH